MKNKRNRKVKNRYKYILILIVIILVISLFFYNNTSKDYEITTEKVEGFIEDNQTKEKLNFEFSEDLSTLDKLRLLSVYDSRINKIIDNYNNYPRLLLEMLTRNLDMLDFVIDYPQKFGNIYSDNVGEIKEGTIPLLLQWDKRWGYAKYGDSSIAISGCGPTALSMVIVGLTGNKYMTPFKVATFSSENGYYVTNIGTSWSLMTEGASKLGVNSKKISLSKNTIYEALEKGHPIICSMRPGDFTTSGHYIVLTGIENGKIKVNDSNSILRSSKLWDYEILKPQIKNLWEFWK